MVISHTENMGWNILLSDVRSDRQPEVSLSIGFDIIANVVRTKYFILFPKRVINSDSIRRIDDRKGSGRVVIVHKTRRCRRWNVSSNCQRNRAQRSSDFVAWIRSTA